MPWRPSASDQVRASAICPTAAAAWLSSSLSGPLGSRSTARPSAIAPDDTTRISRPCACSLAISAASEASHASLTRPASASTSRDDPTLTTMRRKSASKGIVLDMRPARSPGEGSLARLRRRRTCPTRRPGLQRPEPIAASRIIPHARRFHRHLGLDLWRMARAVLSAGRAEKGLAALLFGAVSHHRDQRLVLSHALARGGARLARADPEGISLRLESFEVHHPLEAAVG